MPAPIERWIVCISGFLQEGRLSGIEKIEDAIHRQCGRESTRVLLKSWKDSPADVASRIWNRCPEGRKPAIVIIGYSYGGYTAVLLARKLQERNLNVEVMLLVDPVFRFFARLPSFLSLGSWWTINVPDNVRKLFSWDQKVNWPRGHRLIVDEERTEHIPQRLLCKHEHADDAPAVFNKAMVVACPGRTAA